MYDKNYQHQSTLSPVDFSLQYAPLTEIGQQSTADV